MDHLHNMDVLREGIGLRAYGQRNPLTEYKIEAFDMFKDLLLSANEETLKVLTRVKVMEVEEEHAETKSFHYNQAADGAVTAPKKAKAQVGRNDPCPCGSGKKYKKCCMT